MFKRTTRLSALLLALVMVLSVVMAVPSRAYAADKAFEDVGESHALFDYVKRVEDRKFYEGDKAGNFNAEDPMTRAQVAKVLVRAKGIEVDEEDRPTEKPFKDVAADHQLAAYILAAKNATIFLGDADGNFNPEGNITRGQAAAVVVRTLGFEMIEDDAVEFTDVPADHTFANEIAILASQGIVTGFQGKFDPELNVTRAQFAKYLVNGVTFLEADKAVAEYARVLADPDATEDNIAAALANAKEKRDALLEDDKKEKVTDAIDELLPVVVVVSISAINDIEVEFGGTYELPETVEVTLSDDSVAEVPVEWDASEVDVNVAGTYEVEGTLDITELEDVAETDLVATVNVVVAEEVSVFYTVTIDANGGTIDEAYAVTEVEEGNDFTVPYTFQSKLAREGYTLTGYTVEGTLLNANGEEVTELSKFTGIYTPMTDVTLTAVWEVTSGGFRVLLYDDNPSAQTYNYALKLTGEDGTEYDLSSNQYGPGHRTWKVEDVPNGTYTLTVDGYTITDFEYFGQPDATSEFVVNEDGTATVELEFVDDKSTTFIRYRVYGQALPSDLTEYEEALAAVEEEDYTEASWAAYQVVVEANVVTKENLQSEVDQATAAIVAAQEELITHLEQATLEVDNAIEAARNAVDKAEESLLDVDISAAKALVDGLSKLEFTGLTLIENAQLQTQLLEEQAELQTRLDAIKEQVDSIVEKVNEAKNQLELDEALSDEHFNNYNKDNIAAYEDALDAAHDGDRAFTTVDEIQAVINIVNVEQAINELPDEITLEDKSAVELAREAYNELPVGEEESNGVGEEYTQILKAAEAKIIKLELAEYKVVKIEELKEVDASLYTENKENLETAIETGITNINGSSTIAWVDIQFAAAKAAIDEIDTDLELATAAVELVENTPDAGTSRITTAQRLINILPEGEEKQDLQERLDLVIADRALRVAKAEALEDLNAYVNKVEYEENTEALEEALEAGEEAINASETVEAVETALGNAKEAIDAIESDADIAFEAYQAEGKAKIDNRVDADDYKINAEALATAIANGHLAVDEATTNLEVDAAVRAAWAVIDEILTDDEVEALEAAEAAVVAAEEAPLTTRGDKVDKQDSLDAAKKLVEALAEDRYEEDVVADLNDRLDAVQAELNSTVFNEVQLNAALENTNVEIIVLGVDINLTETVELNKDLNGNNKNLRGKIQINADDVTIDDVTIDGGGNGSTVIISGKNAKITNSTLKNAGKNTWDAVIQVVTTGDVTIEKCHISEGFRGIFVNNEVAAAKKIIVNDSFIDGVYPININGASVDTELIVSNSDLNGWTSYSAIKSATFTDVSFGKETLYNQYAFIRPYGDTTFINCDFSDEFQFSSGKAGIKVDFINSKINDVKLTEAMLKEKFEVEDSVITEEIKNSTWMIDDVEISFE